MPTDPNNKSDKYEEIENADLQTPGVGDDDDLQIDDGNDIEEPETVGKPHVDDPESGKNLGKDDDDRIPQDSDPSE